MHLNKHIKHNLVIPRITKLNSLVQETNIDLKFFNEFMNSYFM